MNEVTVLNTDNFAAMAKAMGIANESSGSSSTLPRMRLNHKPIMGIAEVNGKNVNMEVVEGGTYRLDVAEGQTYYATEIKIRPFLQRLMLKRFIKGSDKTPNRFVKTLMSDDLNIDLKDTDGGFNCGKPSGYIKDFKALPENMQSLIKQIKRVRAIFGEVEMVNPVNDKGEPVELDPMPFIWEVDNRDAFAEFGKQFTRLNKMKRLPIMHHMNVTASEQKLPNGDSYYLPVVALDLINTIDATEEDQNTFNDFIAWVDNYNTYVSSAWSDKARSTMDEEDVDVVDALVDIDDEDEVA